MPSGDNLRLETWKEVAAFFNRDERTVKRWEAQRGLPIRRLPGSAHGRIYALIADLEAWRIGGASTSEATTEPAVPGNDETLDTRTTPEPTRRPWLRLAVVATAFMLIAVAGGWLWNRERPPHRSTAPSFAAQRAYVAATLDWQKRTPDALERAERGYQAAIASAPNYAPGYVGLANTYNMLREYTGMPDAEAYPLAKANALKAIALDDTSSGAHAALAFAEYWGFWDIAKARAEFARAIQLDPDNVTAHHWYATFLSNLGEEGSALQEINAAQRLEPRSSGIGTDRGLIIALGGDRQAGIAVLRRQAAGAPHDRRSLAFIAAISLKAGDYPTYLAARRVLAGVDAAPGDVAAAAAADQAYRQGGPSALLARLIADGTASYIKNQRSAFDLAVLNSLAGDENKAFALLQTSADRRESAFLQITNPINFRSNRPSPAFKALVARLKPLDE